MRRRAHPPRSSWTRARNTRRPREASPCSWIRRTFTRQTSRCREAEQAWNDQPDDPNTIDLAVIAQRKSQIAEAQAAALNTSQDAEAAKRELMTVTAAQLQNARGQLDQTKLALQTEQKNSAEQRQKLADLETKLKDARDTIAKLPP